MRTCSDCKVSGGYSCSVVGFLFPLPSFHFLCSIGIYYTVLRLRLSCITKRFMDAKVNPDEIFRNDRREELKGVCRFSFYFCKRGSA